MNCEVNPGKSTLVRVSKGSSYLESTVFAMHKLSQKLNALVLHFQTPRPINSLSIKHV